MITSKNKQTTVLSYITYTALCTCFAIEVKTLRNMSRLLACECLFALTNPLETGSTRFSVKDKSKYISTKTRYLTMQYS